MSARIYIEGGGDSKDLGIRLQRAFTKLFESMGFAGRLPKPRWGGGREQTFDKFRTAHQTATLGHFVAMLLDSECPVENSEATWAHLKVHDNWDRPNAADDEQVLFMVTCMETWIVADRDALRSHYGANLQENALPALNGMELRARDWVQGGLSRATRTCRNAYAKGKRSFEVLEKLDPIALRLHLPSFVRLERILQQKL